ncbi:MAG: PfkB family carbohydrate kinase [Planctomycetota bacterium]
MNTPLDSLGSPRILVVGDLMLDRYVKGQVERISPEGPIPVLREQSRDESPGGAANVACNLVAMGAKAELAGLVGRDGAGQRLKTLLKARGVGTSLIVATSAPTSVKTRFLAQGQQLLRLDREETPLPRFPAAAAARLLQRLKHCDLVILSDYAKGTLSDDLLRRLIATCRKHGVPVLVDPKRRDFRAYRGATLVTPNLREASVASGLDIRTEADLKKAANILLAQTGSKDILITRGPEGMSLIGRSGAFHVPTRAKTVFDVSGAGDSSLAALAMGWSAKLDPVSCLHLANLAGGVAVGRLGAQSVSLDDLREAEGDEEMAKLLPYSEAGAWSAAQRKAGRRIALTTGCFDLLHPGHLSLLREASRHADLLVVGINSDASVRRLKGPTRPVTSETQRAHMLGGFDFVHKVVVFSGLSPRGLIARLKPAVWVKGADYAGKGETPAFKAEAAEVRRHGGRVHLARFLKGHSTTGLVNKLRKV